MNPGDKLDPNIYAILYVYHSSFMCLSVVYEPFCFANSPNSPPLLTPNAEGGGEGVVLGVRGGTYAQPH